ncbi:MAG: hypothetical protein FJ033_15760, partial [Chloroflexi bacterium]|nr:hypothetical protein [Chloroflexota bacterium]
MACRPPQRRPGPGRRDEFERPPAARGGVGLLSGPPDWLDRRARSRLAGRGRDRRRHRRRVDARVARAGGSRLLRGARRHHHRGGVGSGADLVPCPGDAGLSAAERQRLLASRARTFALATGFLPRGDREAVAVLYAFCRTVDDLVDEPSPDMSRAAVAASLAAWRGWLERGLPPRAAPHPPELAAALREVVRERAVPTRYLCALIDGVASDLEPVRVP